MSEQVPGTMVLEPSWRVTIGQLEPARELELSAQLARKIAGAYEAIRPVDKDGYNQFHKYKFATAEDIYRSCRQGLKAVGLAILPQMRTITETIETSKDGKRTIYLRVQMDFVLMDAETGYRAVIPWAGEVAETGGDKAINKALTSALKYLLRTVFLMPTDGEDDPDGSSNERPGGNGRAQQRPSAGQRQQPKPEAQPQPQATAHASEPTAEAAPKPAPTPPAKLSENVAFMLGRGFDADDQREIAQLLKAAHGFGLCKSAADTLDAWRQGQADRAAIVERLEQLRVLSAQGAPMQWVEKLLDDGGSWGTIADYEATCERRGVPPALFAANARVAGVATAEQLYAVFDGELPAETAEGASA